VCKSREAEVSGCETKQRTKSLTMMCRTSALLASQVPAGQLTHVESMEAP
jgi:hypothetical protein